MSDEERRLLEAPVRASDGQGSEVVGPPTAWGDKGERFREELIDYGRALLAAKRVTVRVTRMNASGAVEAIEDREEPVAAQVAGVARAIQSLVAVQFPSHAQREDTHVFIHWDGPPEGEVEEAPTPAVGAPGEALGEAPAQ